MHVCSPNDSCMLVRVCLGRAALDAPNNNVKQLDPAGKGHLFTRSYRGQKDDDGAKGRLSFRVSRGLQIVEAWKR